LALLNVAFTPPPLTRSRISVSKQLRMRGGQAVLDDLSTATMSGTATRSPRRRLKERFRHLDAERPRRSQVLTSERTTRQIDGKGLGQAGNVCRWRSAGHRLGDLGFRSNGAGASESGGAQSPARAHRQPGTTTGGIGTRPLAGRGGRPRMGWRTRRAATRNAGGIRNGHRRSIPCHGDPARAHSCST
jgi:hypothetical protein